MIKRTVSLCLALLLFVFLLCGCDFNNTGNENSSGTTSGPQYYYFQMYDDVQTPKMTFSITNVTLKSAYDGASPTRALFADMTIEIANNTDKDVTVSVIEFAVIWGKGEKDFAYPSERVIGKTGVFPEKLKLKQGETGEYHLIFDLPAGLETVNLIYGEDLTGLTQKDAYYVGIPIG